MRPIHPKTKREMKPTELRVGNYVYPNQAVRIYANIREIKRATAMFTDYLEVDIDSLVPVPLTEELLLKCGFEKQASDYEVSHPDYCEWLERKYPVIGVVYQSDAKDCLLVEINGEEVHIHNLHQLQNLYFAITGEELTIEL